MIFFRDSNEINKMKRNEEPRVIGLLVVLLLLAFFLLSSVSCLADETSADSRILFYHQYDNKTDYGKKMRANYLYEDIIMKYYKKDKNGNKVTVKDSYGQTQATLGSTGCSLFSGLHAYQWLFGKFDKKTQYDMAQRIVDKLDGRAPYDGGNGPSVSASLCTSAGAIKIKVKKNALAIKEFFDITHGALYHHVPNHYMISVGYTYHNISGKNTFLLHAVDSSNGTTIKYTNSGYGFKDFKYKNTGLSYNQGGEYWLPLTGAVELYWGLYNPNAISKPSSIEIRNIAYPKKLATSKGWDLQTGVVISNRRLSSINVWIEKKSTHEKVSKMASPKDISGSGYVFFINQLDEGGGKDNGQKFSKVTDEGDYIWHIEATDEAGRPASVDIPFYAAPNLGTEVAYKSSTDTSTAVDYIDRNFGKAYYSISTTVKPINSNTGLYYQPYSDSQKMLTVNQTEELHVKNVVLNDFNDYWLQVEYQGNTYFLCANMVKEAFVGPREFVKISSFDYPKGDYKLKTVNGQYALVNGSIPMHGIITSICPITEVTGGWYTASTQQPVDNNYIKTVQVNREREFDLTSSKINQELKGNSLAQLGPGTYYFQLSVTYLKYKNVTKQNEEPFEKVVWYPTPAQMPFTVGGGETISEQAVLISSINLDPISLTMDVGQVKYINYTVTPDNAKNKKIGWKSSNQKVVTVSDGKVTAVGPGTATITASSEDGSNKQATCSVTVTKKVDEVVVSPTALTIYVGDAPQQLSATVNPSDASNKTVTWSSSNSKVATVDSTGLVTIKAEGTTTIAAKAKDGSEKQGTCKVEVRSYVESVTVSGSNTVNVGSSIKLSSTILPSTAYNKKLSWTSSDPTIAKVDPSNGEVTGKKPGSVTITAKAMDRETKTGTKTITVKQPVTGISLSGPNSVLRGKNITISAVVSPSNASNKVLSWTSEKPNVAEVNNGVVNAEAMGSTTIWATATDGSGKKASFHIQVQEPVAQITISGAEIVPVSGTIPLTATVSPANAGNKSVSWSTDPSSIATINGQGVLKGGQPGIVTVTATSKDGSGVSATYSVRVVKQVIAVQINGDRSVYTGQEKQLTATVTSDQPLDDTGVIWSSSDETVVTVSEEGKIRGVGNGTAIITATSKAENYYSASHTVTVTTLVNRITISGNNKLDEGNSTQLTANVSPATATNKKVKWSSNNEDVATVDGSGKVYAVSEGTAVITATAADGSGIKGTLGITVYPLPHSVTIDGTDALLVGETAQLNATVLPTNSRNKNIIWSSGDGSVATVDANGMVTAVGNGTVTIVASAEGNVSVLDTYEIIVTTRVFSVEMNAPEKINVGETDVISAEILPLTASNKGLEWSSSDEDLAVVDTEGNVTALAPGFVTITASAVDGSGVVAEAEVEVFQPVQSVSLDMEPFAYVGQTLLLETRVYPENASNQNLDYFIDNESVARIADVKDVDGQYYKVHFNGTGLIELTATATDGSGISGNAYILVLPYTELRNTSEEYTLYTGGQSNSLLGTVSLSSDSAYRAAEDKYGAVWTIEHVSGDYAAVLGMNENRASYYGFSLADRVDLNLLLIKRTGTDVYRVSCTVSGQTASCDVTVHVVQPAAPLPESVSLPTATYNAQVGETISIDVASPVIQPAGAALPGETNKFLYGRGTFNRYAQVSMDDDVFTVTFNKAGVYSAYIRYSGANYEYDADVQFVVTSTSGTVPPEVEEITINTPVKYMLTGETSSFDINVIPSAADDADLLWSSSDPDVVSVSSDGTLTALQTGTSVITVSADNGVSATGYVAVTETLLSIDWNDEEVIEVYVGGDSRTVIQRVYLTPRASEQLTEAPTWSMKRVDGNNLTLTCEPITGKDSNGHDLYGCAIILKSVSAIGMTEYELTCSDGLYSTSSAIKVNANEIESRLPSMVSWSNTIFTGEANELLSIRPVLQCWPDGTTLPDSALISIDGDQYWKAALNMKDYAVSRNAITLSFNEPGIYTANCVYSCSNMRYLVPVTFRIKDINGNVPVRVMRLTLNENEISVQPNNTFQLTATIEPSDATNKNVTWSSADTSIASVNSNGLVTGVAKGRTTITCMPSDTSCEPVQCVVVVEDAFSVTTYTEMTTQYLQGETGNAVAGFELTSGTAKRIEQEGATAIWTLNRISGNAANVELQERNGRQYIVATELLRGGSDTYEVTCTAGTHIWTGQASLQVKSLGTVPDSVTIAQTSYTADVGEEIELNFTPVCSPGTASIPSNLRATYVGIGDFYDSLVDSYRTSVLVARSDTVKVAFKKPGVYLFTRVYRGANLNYVTECTITVSGGKINLLKCSDDEPVVYIGGKSSIVSTCVIADNSIEELYGDELIWTAERLSGDCLTVALRADQSSASLYVVNAKDWGEETWRVSCTFRNITDYVDITIHAVEARTELPESVTLYQNEFSGMIGNTVEVPLAVQCSPDGTSLPSTDTEAWSFSTDWNTKAHATWAFAENQMRITFTESGYYGGNLVYQAGNVSYSLPVSFAITDEESVQPQPTGLSVSLNKNTVTVYPEGETGVGVVKALLSKSQDAYSISSVAAFAEQNHATWSLEIVSGTACTLSLRSIGAASVQVVIDSINGSGDVTYKVSCAVSGNAYTAQGTVHVASSSEARPQPQMKQSYYVTPTGTVLTIDASFYDKTTNVKLCNGLDSIWDNTDAMAAMGFEYETRDDLWLPIFYEAGTYTTTISNMIGNLPCSQEVKIAVYTSRNLPGQPSTLSFPTALQVIDEEAFAGINVNVIDLRGTNVKSINTRAFANIGNLMRVYIPSTVNSISTDAFAENSDFVIYCVQGSFTDTWAQQQGYPVIYID